jgi:hypothetical protein
MMKGNLLETKFLGLLNDDTEYRNKLDSYSDKKSDLIIKHREKVKIMKKKHSQQTNTLRMKQSMEVKMLMKKHSENLQSLYGRTMN